MNVEYARTMRRLSRRRIRIEVARRLAERAHRATAPEAPPVPTRPRER